jgi:hypothetical protein
MAQSQAQK